MNFQCSGEGSPRSLPSHEYVIKDRSDLGAKKNAFIHLKIRYVSVAEVGLGFLWLHAAEEIEGGKIISRKKRKKKRATNINFKVSVNRKITFEE